MMRTSILVMSPWWKMAGYIQVSQVNLVKPVEITVRENTDKCKTSCAHSLYKLHFFAL